MPAATPFRNTPASPSSYKAARMAALLLAALLACRAINPEWTAERISEAMTAGKTSTVKLTEPLPVVVLYTTAIVDTDRKLRFAPDIYGYDGKLEQALGERQ